MPQKHESISANQAAQRELVERGRSLPGVAAMLDVHGQLAAYTQLIVNVQPSQVRNATGGNVH